MAVLFTPESWAWLRGQPTPIDTYREDADMARLRGGDVSTPFYSELGAQQRLAEIEQLLADHARSEGRKPSGSVRQQVEALIERLDEQDKQSI